MSESKKTVKRAAEAEEKKYSTEKLLKSRRFAAYQPEFARVILTEPEYTISGAIDALEKALKGGR